MDAREIFLIIKNQDKLYCLIYDFTLSVTREKLKTNEYIYICNIQRFVNENALIYCDVMKVSFYFTGEISNLFNGIIPVFHDHFHNKDQTKSAPY
jgi:hypothetical protein